MSPARRSAGEGLSELLEDERILRHVSSEVLFVNSMAINRSATADSIAQDAEGVAAEMRVASEWFQARPPVPPLSFSTLLMFV